MLYFYGDESVLFYGVLRENLVFIDESIKQFRLQNSLKNEFEFHYYDNTRNANKQFSDFILGLPIKFQILTSVTFDSGTASHIASFDEITTILTRNTFRRDIKCFFDKLGGPKIESILRTEFGRFCRHKSIKLKKPIQFIDSRKSDFIQIADYLVAMNNQSKI